MNNIFPCIITHFSLCKIRQRERGKKVLRCDAACGRRFWNCAGSSSQALGEASPGAAAEGPLELHNKTIKKEGQFLWRRRCSWAVRSLSKPTWKFAWAFAINKQPAGRSQSRSQMLGQLLWPSLLLPVPGCRSLSLAQSIISAFSGLCLHVFCHYFKGYIELNME